MKLLLCSLASLVVMTAMPARATADGSTDYTVLVGMVDQAQQAWRAKQPTKPYWVDIKSQIPGWTDAATEHKARLGRALEDLIERAQNAQLVLEDFWRMKAMIIDCKCSSEVRRLWREAKGRNATRQQFEYCANLIHERGEAAQEHPDLRQMLQDAINQLKKQYLAGEDLTLAQTSYFDDESVRSMLDRAMKWLEDMAVERKATREQFEYVRDLMKDRARIWSEDAAMQALLRRVEAELDRLMSRDFATATFGRDDFIKLREMVLKKARAVVSTPTGAAG